MPTKIVNTYPAREPLEATRADLAVKDSGTMANGSACQKGDVLGVTTADGLFRRRTRAVAAGAAFSAASPNGVVDDASVFKPGDVLKNAAGNNIGTIAANGVNTVTNTVTLTGNAAVAVAAGASVLGSDGSEVASVISEDANDGAGETPVTYFLSGFLKAAKIRGLDSTAITELGGKLKPGGIFRF